MGCRKVVGVVCVQPLAAAQNRAASPGASASVGMAPIGPVSTYSARSGITQKA